MGLFARAVITGFGFSLGATLFKRVSKQLGLEDTEKSDTPQVHPVAAADEDSGDTARSS